MGWFFFKGCGRKADEAPTEPPVPLEQSEPPDETSDGPVKNPSQEQSEAPLPEPTPDEGAQTGIEEESAEASAGEEPAPSLDTLAERPYVSRREHLWDELQRIDFLLRAQTLRWRLTVAAGKPEHLWGMINVTDAEVNAYLGAPFYPPGVLPDELTHRAMGFWTAAQRMRRAIRERLLLTPPNIQLRLVRLRELFGLSDLDQDLLLITLLPELDGRYRRLYGYLMDDASRTRPTLELATQILYPEAPHPEMVRAVLEEGAPLIFNRLMQVDAEGQGSELPSMRSLRVDDRIGAYLLGNEGMDGRLQAVLSRPADSITWDQLIAERQRIDALQDLARNWRMVTDLRAALLLHGPFGGGRRRAAQALCSDLGKPLLIADVAAALSDASSWERLLPLVYREALLQDAAVYWDGCDALFERDQPIRRWELLLQAAEDFPGLSFLACESAHDPTARFRETPFLRLEFPAPGYELRLRLWRAHLPEPGEFRLPAPDPQILAELLANGFQLTEGQIRDAVATARWLALGRAPAQPQVTSDDLYEGCRRQSGRRLITFARRIEPRTELSFDDIVLPDTNRRQLDELRLRIRLRSQVYTGLGFERRLSLGKGLIALFSGSSGTGKTMAAELLAREQGVDLYKVDLSAVVSKYVGETEKNLSRVFSEAEDANAIILFDEADALFGRRGEVKEAQDRWANMEINYLLQRVEEYAGVVILTSNLRQNIDDAFLRRIHVIVELPFPEADARLRILCGLFPPGIERPAVTELEELAERFKLAGGNYKNIVLDAAFRALGEASGKTPAVSQRHLVAAVAREYQKLGKPLTKGDFGTKFYDCVKEDIL